MVSGELELRFSSEGEVGDWTVALSESATESLRNSFDLRARLT